MASNNFTYSPTTGQGNTNVSVCAVTTNSSNADYNASLTFSNGINTKSVTIKQKFRPYRLQGPTGVSYTGGSITITAMTEYDIVFRSVPTWITGITVDGRTYTQGERIPASVNGMDIRISAAPNNTNTGRSAGSNWDREGQTIQGSGMNMAWYVGNTLITTPVTLIEVRQEPDTSGINTDVNELIFDYNANVAQTIQVITNANWTSTIQDN